MIGALKRRGAIDGRTVRVADKGLNCADNIADALLCGDGYIFSKSPRMLPETEERWLLSEEGWRDVPGADMGASPTGSSPPRASSATA